MSSTPAHELHLRFIRATDDCNRRIRELERPDAVAWFKRKKQLAKFMDAMDGVKDAISRLAALADDSFGAG